MGCRILELTDGRAVLHDSVTEKVFGQIFQDIDAAESFIQWTVRETGKDPRALNASALEDAVEAWRLASA